MRKEKGKTGRENRRQEKKKEDVAPSEIISVKQGHCVSEGAEDNTLEAQQDLESSKESRKMAPG